MFFGAIPVFKCPNIIPTTNSKKSQFCHVQKLEYLWNRLSKLKKQTHSKILLLRAFKCELWMSFFFWKSWDFSVTTLYITCCNTIIIISCWFNFYRKTEMNIMKISILIPRKLDVKFSYFFTFIRIICIFYLCSVFSNWPW